MRGAEEGWGGWVALVMGGAGLVGRAAWSQARMGEREGQGEWEVAGAGGLGAWAADVAGWAGAGGLEAWGAMAEGCAHRDEC